MNRMYKYLLTFCLLLLSALLTVAQNSCEELENLLRIALENNMGLKSYLLQADAAEANIGTAFDFDKTGVYYGYDQNNYAPNDKALNVIGVQQRFDFPTIYAARKSLYKSQWQEANARYEIEKNKLMLELSAVYQQLVYLQNKKNLYIQLDSLYYSFANAGSRKFELGETTYLEKIMSEAKAKQIRTGLLQLESLLNTSYGRLKTLLQVEDSIMVMNSNLQIISYNTEISAKENHLMYHSAIELSYENRLKLNKHGWFPDFTVELYTGTNKGLGYHQNGIQVGLSIPLFFGGNLAKTKTAKLELQSWQMKRADKERKMNDFINQKLNELNRHHEMVNYYNQNGNNLSDEIIKTAEMSFKNGEIDFFQYIQSLENAIGITIDYLDSILAYNISYLELYYFNYTDSDEN